MAKRTIAALFLAAASGCTLTTVQPTGQGKASELTGSMVGCRALAGELETGPAEAQGSGFRCWGQGDETLTGCVRWDGGALKYTSPGCGAELRAPERLAPVAP